MNGQDKINTVITIMCDNFQIPREEFNNLLKRKENRYLLLLLLKNYRCLNREIIKGLLNVISDKSIRYNINKAEEKLYINKEFRDRYFEMEKGLDKII